MDIYETYQSNAAETPRMRKWMLLALVLSLALHAGLVAFFHLQKLENFGNANVERLAPPFRVMTRVSIPNIPAEDVRVTLPEKVPTATRIAIPADQPQVQELHIAPQLPELPKPLVIEKPKVDLGGWEALAKVEANSRGAMEKELNSLAGSLMKESPRSPRQPVLNLPPSTKTGEGGLGNDAGIPGRQSLDEALARTGPLPVGDKPIGMPGGALYEHDSYELKPDALGQLAKLGELIQRNPKATFSIEGHTDSFGEKEYNDVLSLRRAESVKAWLVQNMRVAPERIQTRGLGNSRMIVPPIEVDTDSQPALDAEIARQQPNRRVEIVIKTNRK